jgi:hypothetical protein
MKSSSLRTATIWDSIDGVLVLNLDRSPERMERFMQKNGHLIPAHKLVRISAAFGRELPGYGEEPWFTERTGERAKFWAGTAGCALSHRRAIEYAAAHDWKNVLILEDDAVVNATDDGLWLMRCALRALKGCYMLYPGFSRPTPYGRCLRRKGDASLWQVEGVLSTYSYIVSKELYHTLLDRLPTEETVWEWVSKNRAIDSFYRDVISSMGSVKTYVMMPDVIIHEDGPSEIAGNTVRDSSHDFMLEPLSYSSWKGMMRVISRPIRSCKRRLNSTRTWLRARRGGFPGFRKRNK